MRKFYFALTLLALVSLGAPHLQGQVLLYTEDFESDVEGTRYVSNTFNDCVSEQDVFLRTNSNPVTPPGCIQVFGTTLTALQGSFFWALEDIRGSTGACIGCRPAGTVTTQNFSISGYNTLSVKLYVACSNNNGSRWESSDSINIQVSIDNGPFRTVGRFMGKGTPIVGSNLGIDGDLNGIFDANDPVTNCDVANFTQYSFNVPGTGTNMKIKIDCDQQGGSEELAFDHIQAYGVLAPCTAPSITCPGTQNLNLNASCQSNVPDYTSLATVSGGTCGPMTVSQTSPAIGSSVSGTGTLTVTLIAQNTALQSSTCTFSMNKVDVTPPTITCPATQTLVLNSSCQALLPNYTSLATGVSDNCTVSPTVAQTPASGTTQTGVGAMTVILGATDASGNTGTCAFTVNKTSPEIDLSGNSNPINDGSTTPTLVNFTEFGTVNVGNNLVRTYTITNSGTAPLTIGGGGITITGTNAAMFTLGGITLPITINPASSTTFTVTFTPTSGGLKTATVNIANNDCNENPYDFAIQGTGNVGPEIDVLGNGQSIVSGDFTPSLLDHTDFGDVNTCSGTVVRTFTIANSGGQNLSINNITITGTNSLDFTVTASPASPIAPSGSTTFQITFDPLANGVRSALVTILNNDADEGSYTYVIQGTGIADLTPPAITCPSAVTVPASPGQCTATATYTAPVGTDNCPSPTTAQVSGLASGSTFPVGVTTNVFRVTDGSGNSTTCSFTVTVTDNQLPSISCPAPISVNANTNVCNAPVAYTAPVGTDNCASPTTTRTSGLASGSLFPVGVTTNVFRVTDGSGNTATCSFTVTVVDAQQPNIFCPSTITGTTDPNLCTKLVTYTTPNGFDNCTGATTVQTAGLPSGSAFPVGTTVNTFRVTDGAGATRTCSFNVIIVDNQAPTLTCPANVTNTTDPGQCSRVVSFASPTPFDNCSNAPGVQTGGLPSGSAFPFGTTTNTFLITDPSNNTGTCAFTVTISDNEPPVISNCPQSVTAFADSSSCGINVAWAQPTITDNCGVDTTISSHPSGDFFPVGTTTVTYSSTDIHGNSSTCSFNITLNPRVLRVEIVSPLQGCGYHLACAGASNGEATTSVFGGCMPYAYIWSTGDSSSTLSGMSAGMSYVTVTDSRNVTAIDSIEITAPTPLLAEVTGDTLVCEGAATGGLTVLAAGGQDCAGYTYLWSNGATTMDALGLPAGVYSVTVTDSLGCTAVAFDTLELGLNPVLQLGADTSACPGASVLFEAPPIYAAYQWNTGSNNSVITMNTPGMYTCTVWTAEGCSDLDTVNFSYYVLDNDIITAIGPLQICDGDTVYLEGDAGLSGYLWSTGATTQTLLVTGFGGDISLSASDTHGCTVRDTIHVAYVPFTDPRPVILPGPSVPLCDGGSVQLDVQSGYFAYLWSTLQTSQTIVVNAVGTYTVTVSNGYGCTSISDPVTVYSVPLPTPVVTYNSGVLTTGNFYVHYQWYRDNVVAIGAIDYLYTPTQQGYYFVVVEDTNGCSDSSNVVFVNPVGAADGLEPLHGIELFPNPARGAVTLRTLNPILKPLEVEVWNMYGQRVRSFHFSSLSSSTPLDMERLAAGPYAVKIRLAGSQQESVIRMVLE